MLSVASILALGVLSQVVPEEEGLRPYIFQMRGQRELLYALVDEDDLEGRVSFEVLIDAPWLPIEERRETLQRSLIVSYDEELPASRANRLEEGWLANGGVRVETPTGTHWVLQSERELAERARGMARKAFPPPPETVAEAVAVPSEPGAAAEAAARPGFFAAWGPHLGVALAAMVALGVLGAFMARS